jgi:hypothetical protein
MKQIPLVSFAFLSALIPAGLAQSNVWLIDDSCFGGPMGSVTAFVQRGMNGAFSLAQKGLEVAQDAANDPNKQRLIDRLFGTADYDGVAPRDEVARIFTQILTYQTEVQNPNGIEIGRGDIVRYPTEARKQVPPLTAFHRKCIATNLVSKHPKMGQPMKCSTVVR